MPKFEGGLNNLEELLLSVLLFVLLFMWGVVYLGNDCSAKGVCGHSLCPGEQWVFVKSNVCCFLL